MAAEPLLAEVHRGLAAPPHRVFAAFAEARLVERWLRPSPEIGLAVLALDFRPGGRYRFAYRLPDGALVHIGGVYRVIAPPHRIVFSWEIEPPDEHAGIMSEVTVTIAAEGTGSALRIRHERLGRDDAVARHAEGWRGALALLGALLDEGEATA